MAGFAVGLFDVLGCDAESLRTLGVAGVDCLGISRMVLGDRIPTYL